MALPFLLLARSQATPSVVPASWLISSEHYAMWLDTGGDGVEFDLGATSPGEASVSIRSAAGPLRLHLLTSDTPAALLRRYCGLTGNRNLSTTRLQALFAWSGA